MALLRADSLGKSFGENMLFQNAGFTIEKHDRIGLVGDNGSGKTTLLKLLMGQLPPDEGTVTLSDGAVLGYMEQHVCRDPHITAYAEVLTAFSRLTELEQQLEIIHLRLRAAGTLSEKELHALVEQQSLLNETYLREGGLTYRSRSRSVLQGLGFDEEKIALPVADLSGGQKAKLQLAKLLLSDADLLLLDEPTNHLDIEAVEWLESFLLEYPGAFLVISHDRYFLDKVTTRTMELAHKTLTVYKGSYSESRRQKEERDLTAQRKYDNTKAEIDRLQKIVKQQRQWNREKNIKTAESKLKAIGRLEATLEEVPKESAPIRLDFTPKQRGGNDVLQLKDLALAFGDTELFRNITLHLRRGERVFLLGPNGCGKTSLFKTILGQYTPKQGSVRLGTNIDVGYYDQIQEGLDPNKTVIDSVWDEYPYLTQTEVRSALALFLFQGDDVFKSVAALSGGERARILLLRLMLARDNFLMLDEPTNHLDILSCEALEDALIDYDGTLFIISHDRYLINKLADRIVVLHPDGLKEYAGSYDDYLAFIRSEKQAAASAEKPTTEKTEEKKPQKENKAEQRKLRVQLRKTEEEIDRLETEIAETEEALSAPEIAGDYVAAMEHTERLHQLQKEVEAQMALWESLSEQTGL